MPTTKSKLTVNDLASMINSDCQNVGYLSAARFVKETITLWKISDNYNLLCETAQIFADHYIAESEAT